MIGALDGSTTQPGTGRDSTRDVYRVFLFRKDGSELLLARAGERFSLPTVEIPRWERATENINAEVRKRFGISAHCLFMPKGAALAALPAHQRLLYQVMEADSDNGLEPEGTAWAAEVSVPEDALADSMDSVALSGVRQEIASYRKGEVPNSLGRPGWIRELLDWVEQKIAPQGWRLTGAMRQLNSGTTFALLRLETNGPAVWFKATGNPNRHERKVSMELSALFPDFLPQVVAVHPGWNGWLTVEVEGQILEAGGGDSAWRSAATALAQLQHAGTPRFQSGQHRRRRGRLCLSRLGGGMRGPSARDFRIPPEPLPPDGRKRRR